MALVSADLIIRGNGDGRVYFKISYNRMREKEIAPEIYNISNDKM